MKIKRDLPSGQIVLGAIEGFEALLSVAMELHSYVTEIEELDPNQWYETWVRRNDHLWICLGVLQSFLDQNETYLKDLNVTLPDHIGVLRVPNPHYKPRTLSRPTEDAGLDNVAQEGTDSLPPDEYPF